MPGRHTGQVPHLPKTSKRSELLPGVPARSVGQVEQTPRHPARRPGGVSWRWGILTQSPEGVTRWPEGVFRLQEDVTQRMECEIQLSEDASQRLEDVYLPPEAVIQ